jgi:flagellar protein FlbD
VIAVTCRNGEHFSVDPLHIERVETDPDTVIHLVDGTKFVVDQTFDELLTTIAHGRAEMLVAQKQLAGGVAEIADHAARASLRVERRARSRDVTPSPAGDDGD